MIPFEEPFDPKEDLEDAKFRVFELKLFSVRSLALWRRGHCMNEM